MATLNIENTKRETTKWGTPKRTPPKMTIRKQQYIIINPVNVDKEDIIFICEKYFGDESRKIECGGGKIIKCSYESILDFKSYKTKFYVDFTKFHETFGELVYENMYRDLCDLAADKEMENMEYYPEI